MSDTPETTKRSPTKVAAAVLLAFAVAGAGVVAADKLTTPEVEIPCSGMCTMCLVPDAPDCDVLALCGGEPCYPDREGGPDPYAASKIALGLRAAREAGAIDTWHTSTAAPGVCIVQAYMSAEQRSGWRAVVDVDAAGSKVIDCRVSALPPQFVKNGGRLNVLAGQDPTRDADPQPVDIAVDAKAEAVADGAAEALGVK